MFWSEVVLLLLNFAVRFKHPGFSSEREWRILSVDPAEDCVMRRNRGDKEVKFINVSFGSEIVTRITLGPRGVRGSEQQLREFLDQSGFREVEIQRSIIPLR